jgi:hypothetical protein
MLKEARPGLTEEQKADMLSRVNQLGGGASIMMAEDHAARGACCS